MRWSGILGAFVGEQFNHLNGAGGGVRPAKGVPERFFGGEMAKKKDGSASSSATVVAR